VEDDILRPKRFPNRGEEKKNWKTKMTSWKNPTIFVIIGDITKTQMVAWDLSMVMLVFWGETNDLKMSFLVSHR